MNTEEELIEEIKNKEVNQLKKYFKNNNIISENYNNFNKTLLYSIQHERSIEIINFIIEQQRNKENIESLFYSIQYQKFNIAKLLLRNKANINGKIKALYEDSYYNIIEYLLSIDALTSKNLSFILNSEINIKLINSELICWLIRDKQNELLKLIFQYSFFSTSFIDNVIVDKFLIGIYRNKKAYSNKQIKNIMVSYFPVININETIEWKDYPLLRAVSNNDISIVKLLFEYANDHELILNINDKDEEGNYPLLKAINNNNYELVKLLIDYATRHDIILNVNEKNNFENYPLFVTFFKGNVNIAELLIEYGDRYSLLLNINEKIRNGNYPLLEAFYKENYHLIHLLIKYADEHGFILNINETDVMGHYPLLEAVMNNNIRLIELLIKYADDHNLILELNKKNEKGNFSLMEVIAQENNINIINLLQKYAKEHAICSEY